MAAITLKEIIETRGFMKVFAEMSKYTQKEKNEAHIECWHSRNQTHLKDRLTYSISFGNENAVRTVPERAFNSSGNEKNVMPTDNTHYTTFNMHTHPPLSYEDPLQVIRFSDEDIETHLILHENAIDGITVFPSKRLARCLLWQPSKKLAGFGCTIYEELEKCMKEKEPDRAAVSYLRNFGKSETIDFKLKKGVWVPESKHLSRLEQFEIKEDSLLITGSEVKFIMPSSLDEMNAHIEVWNKEVKEAKEKKEKEKKEDKK